MMETRRHAPLNRRRAITAGKEQHQRLPHAYLGRRRRQVGDVYSSDHSEQRRGGRFRWLLSTCLAATVGIVAIGVVIGGSMDGREEAGLMPALRGGNDQPALAFQLPAARNGGLNWAVAKADRLLVASGALSTRFIIQDSVRQRRGKQDFIVNRPFARIVARLAPVPVGTAEKIPAFNPYKLYANVDAATEGAKSAADTNHGVALRIVDILGGALPAEDGQELDAREVAEIIARAAAPDEDTTVMRPSFRPDGTDRFTAPLSAAERAAKPQLDSQPINTTVLGKTLIETDDGADDIDDREMRIVRVAKGDTLKTILTRLGAEAWQTNAMVEAARTAFPDGTMVAGQEVHATMVPSVTRANRMETVRVSVFGEGQAHKVTVLRNGAGEYVASASPIDERRAVSAGDGETSAQGQSLYASLYHAAQSQDLSPDTIMQVLRIHAFETDFRRRVRAGDTVELFYDMRDEERGGDTNLGELLATSLTTAGETHRFYRFRSTDGVVDYYDENGNTSRKFLMRRPVRGDDVRLTSGFGARRHPLSQTMRMHAGIDWAGPIGTPIMAAGSGVIEEAGRKGEYGNYIRIRHANGYKTAYGHMNRFVPGIGDGARVRQGQLIGYIGTSGISTGPHLHFEVLVNNQHVDPMSIQVPRERKLTGKALGDFQKERARVDDLLRRAPVSSKVADAGRR